MPAQPPGGSPVPSSADSEPEPKSESESGPEPEPEPPAALDLSQYAPPQQPPLSQNPPPGVAAPAPQYPPPKPDLSQYPPPQPPQPPIQQYPPPQYPAYGGPPPPGYRPASPPGAATTNQRILGLVLVVPALLLWVFTLLDPSIRTLWRSFHGQRFTRVPVRSRGAGNYSDAIHQGYLGSIGNGLFWSLGPLVAVGVVAPALAFLAWRAGTGLRRTVLVAFALPIATFTPTGWAFAQLGTRHHTVFDPKHHDSTTRLFFWTATFAFACSLATMLYLAALRRWAPGPWGPGRMGPLVAVWVVLVLAAVAFTEQSFAVSYALGVSQKHAPPELFQFQRAFRLFILGPAEAASAMTLMGLAVLGLAAGLVVVFSRLRIQIEPPTPRPATATAIPPTTSGPPDLAKADAPPPPGGPVSRPWRPDPAVVIVGAVVLAAVLVVTGWALWPWFSKAFHGGTAANHGVSTATRLKNTLLPPLIAVLIQVPAAFLAALGIGALRPLGRWSELLLVPFLPWLFVTMGPLSITFFSDAGNGHDLNKFSTLTPRILLSVPALVLLTALCRGLAVRWRAARTAGAPAGATFWRAVFVPALPMVLLLAGVEYLVTVQDVHWPVLATFSPNHFTGAMLLFESAQQVAAPSGAPIAWTLPPVLMVLSAIGLIALMVTYVDRLSIRTGPVETE